MDRFYPFKNDSETEACDFVVMVVIAAFFACVYLATLGAASWLLVDKTPTAMLAVVVMTLCAMSGYSRGKLEFEPNKDAFERGAAKVAIDATAVAILYLFVCVVRGGQPTFFDCLTVAIITGVSAVVEWSLIICYSTSGEQLKAGKWSELASSAASSSTLFVISTMRLLTGGGA